MAQANARTAEMTTQCPVGFGNDPSVLRDFKEGLTFNMADTREDAMYDFTQIAPGTEFKMAKNRGDFYVRRPEGAVKAPYTAEAETMEKQTTEKQTIEEPCGDTASKLSPDADWNSEDEEDTEAVGTSPTTTALTPAKKTVFQCTWTTGSCCTNTFPTHHRMRDHLRAVHLGKRVTCPVCDKGFTYHCDVKRHYRRKHKDGPPLMPPVKKTKTAPIK
jgi:hypothetical protein